MPECLKPQRELSQGNLYSMLEMMRVYRESEPKRFGN